LAITTIASNNGGGTTNATTRDGTPIVVKGEGVAPPNQALIVDGEISTQVPGLPQTSTEA